MHMNKFAPACRSLGLLALVSLTACGGGGGQTPPPPPPPASFLVTVTPDSGGTVTPATQSVVMGHTASITLTAYSGYAIGSVETGVPTADGIIDACDGSLQGSVYTTAVISGPCAVSVYFTNTPTSAPITTTRVSVASDGTQANGDSGDPVMSSDGRYVAFWSIASNLVAGDTNGYADIFVRDRQLGVTTRVSVASDGAQSDGISTRPAISGDGRYVTFVSTASNLVSGDTNGVADLFVHDCLAGTIQRVSMAFDGSQANADSDDSAMTADGRYIAFTSYASNLVANDTNGGWDIFVFDQTTHATARVSVSSAGAEAMIVGEGSFRPSISSDGRYVAFESGATNLVAAPNNGAIGAYVHDRSTGTTLCISPDPVDPLYPCMGLAPAISSDGRYVAYATNTFDRLAGDPLVLGYNIFVFDQTTAALTRASLTWRNEADAGTSLLPAISADGSAIAFSSSSSGLVDGDRNGGNDIFIRDMMNQVTGRASLPSGRGESFGTGADAERPALSGDGRRVAYASAATTLVPADTNQAHDIFVSEW